MADIQVVKSEREDGYEFQVAVKEGRSETSHRVTLREADYQRLAGGVATGASSGSSTLACQSEAFCSA